MAKSYSAYTPQVGDKGPFALDARTVGRLPSGPGVYLLCDAVGRRLVVRYVGRSGDVRTRLANWIGRYSAFVYRATSTERGAFFTECRVFHTYGKRSGLDNRVHPAVPPGSSLPLCHDMTCRGEPD